MKRIFSAIVIIALIIMTSVCSGQGEGVYHDLSKDPFVSGGLKPDTIINDLLPAFAAAAPKEKSDEAIRVAFNYDIPKLVIAYRDSKGKYYQRTGKLAKGENVIGTVLSKVADGNSWKITALVRWVEKCSNPLTHPFQIIVWVPKIDIPGPQTVIERIEVPKPYAVTVERNVVIQQIVPSVGDINITLPPAERGRYKLTIVGNMEAGRRWEYQKDFWDHFLDFAKVAAFPLGMWLQRPAISNLNNSSSSVSQGGQGGTGGNGYGAAAAAAAAASSSSSTAVTPTSGAGSSGGSSGSSGSSAGGGGSNSGSGSP